jgi:hypothetical protein
MLRPAYPNVNTYASVPRSRKVISSVRSRTASCPRTSWYLRDREYEHEVLEELERARMFLDASMATQRFSGNR